MWVGEHERELVTERAQAALLGEQLTTARVRAEGAALNGVRAGSCPVPVPDRAYAPEDKNDHDDRASAVYRQFPGIRLGR